MKHQSAEARRAFMKEMQICNILSSMQDGHETEAVDYAIANGMTPEQLGIISQYDGMLKGTSEEMAKLCRQIRKEIENQ